MRPMFSTFHTFIFKYSQNCSYFKTGFVVKFEKQNAIYSGVEVN